MHFSVTNSVAVTLEYLNLGYYSKIRFFPIPSIQEGIGEE